MANCPFCNGDVSVPRKEWKYGRNYYRVKAFVCSNCGLSFRGYYHGNKFSHTIPKTLDDKKKILRYFQAHEKVSKEEISEIFKISTSKVDIVFRELQEEGKICNY